MHALTLCPVDVFVDTHGIGFAYPIVKLMFGPKIYSYTHYPTVSEDMVKTVTSG
jgi:alpha-1,2-mannosyltransferase